MLDPIVAIRSTVVIEPDETARVDLVTGVAETREAALALVEKYHDRAPGRPRLRAGLDAQPGGAAPAQRHRGRRAALRPAGRLRSSTPTPLLRAAASVIATNRRGQSGLWGYGISGDLPIVLLRIGDLAQIDLVRQLVQAHAYWRLKGLAVDLVIWNEDQSGYRQVAAGQIMGVIAAGAEAQPARPARAASSSAASSRCPRRTRS